ncbi:MAG: OBAP family protein [Thiobacillus sp.]
MSRNVLLLSLIAAFPWPALAADDVGTPTRPPGAETSSKTRVLKAGSAALQSESPLKPMHVHLSGFHAMKNDPAHQMAADHYCSQVNEDFAQCALFDGNTRSANLTGIEYIISERLFKQLPEPEKQYWHPHNYEFLSGQLVAPGLPDVAEKALMKGKMNSYGKTWHVWNTGDAKTKGDPLPYGDPALAWSFNRDGEADAGMVQRRDRALEIDPAKKRRGRADLTPLARPQQGVDALHGKFVRPGQPLPGVVEAGSSAPAKNPTLPR